MGVTVLAERVTIRKDAEFEALHPRDDHGRFSLVGAALSKLADQFGEIISHEEFGEPGSGVNSHGVMTLHADGSIAITSIEDETDHRVIMHVPAGRDDDYLGELTDSISTAAEDAPNTEDIESYDYSEEHGSSLEVSFGQLNSGPFVALDTENDGLSFTPEYAEDFVTQFGEMRERRRTLLGGDPTITRPLPEGEHLERRKGFPNDYRDHAAITALVSTPAGPRIRLGVVSSGEGEDRRWTGGRGLTTIDLDRDSAAELADILEEFDRNGKERQKVFDRIKGEAIEAEEAGEDVDWNDVSAMVTNELGGDFEDDFEDRKVETPWGTVRLTDVGMDDEDNAHDRHTRVEIWPAGMTEAQYDAGQEPSGGSDWAWPGSKDRYEKPSANLNARQMRALIKLLRGSFDEPTTTKSAGSATDTPGAGRARALKRYWTRGEGLAKWVRSAHPWTTLRRHLAKYIHDPDKLDRTTSAWFHSATGMWSGERKGKNPLGRG